MHTGLTAEDESVSAGVWPAGDGTRPVSGPFVVVAGALASKPENGGEAWARLSWVRGLERLGCQVAFLEEIDDRVCVDPFGRPAPLGLSLNLRWFQVVTDRFGLTGRSALVSPPDRESDGGGSGRHRTLYTSGPQGDDLLSGADLLVNIGGNLSDPCLRSLARRRVYVDVDPGFTQMWHSQGQERGRLAGHDRYFTIGMNIGAPDCTISGNGIEWLPLRPPVVLADWPEVPVPRPLAPRPARHRGGAPVRRRFTTVATWRSPYGPVEWEKRRFGLKVHELRNYIDLPRMVDGCFEAALAVHPSEVDDLSLLSDQGWALADPRLVAGTTESFRRYVTGSDAEFSVAQEMYVATGSGWFSDRTTCYLATGRPALVQDTGFSRHIPAKKGLVAFSTPEEAAAGARYILSDYDAHAAAARTVAEEHFDSDRVLAGFLEACGLD